ncbi:MAG: hypothetical protein U0174_03600 [Polyangiaceae bacterium]
MSDPKRLLDELADDSGGARLLASGLGDAPSRATKARIAGALGLATTAAAGSGASTGAAAATAKGSAAQTSGALIGNTVAGSVATKTATAGVVGFFGAKGVWIASLLGIIALSGGLASTFATRSVAPSAPSAPVETKAQPVASASVADPSAPAHSASSADSLEVAPIVPVVPSLSPVSRGVASNATKLPNAVSSNAPSDVAEELRLVENARKALRGGNPSASLTVLQTYDATYPHGVLALEANVLRAEALVRSGRRKEGQALATRLLQATPSGPHASRLRKLLEVEDATTP